MPNPVVSEFLQQLSKTIISRRVYLFEVYINSGIALQRMQIDFIARLLKDDCDGFLHIVRFNVSFISYHLPSFLLQIESHRYFNIRDIS